MALAYMRAQRVTAAPARQDSGLDRADARHHGAAGRRIGVDEVLADAGWGACRQWSIGRCAQATLVRHFIDVGTGADLAQRTPPLAPARAASSMLEPTGLAALVALRGLSPPLMAARERAGPAAIQLTAVAVGTQQHLVAATRAQEQAG